MANRLLSGLAALVGAAQQIKNTIDQNKNSTTQSSTNKGTSGSTSGGYVPYDTSGNNYAAMAGMTPAEQAALEAAKNSYNQHKASGNQAGMDAAHMQAEAIRKNYGYSGGEDGKKAVFALGRYGLLLRILGRIVRQLVFRSLSRRFDLLTGLRILRVPLRRMSVGRFGLLILLIR